MRLRTSLSIVAGVLLATTASSQDFGPDGFGNIGTSIPGNFIDVSGSGTDITAGFGANLDDAGQVVAIGFSHDLYGTSISSIGVSTNGYLADDADLTDFTNDCPIATGTTPNRGIYPFWDDLRLTEHGQVFTELQGTAPDRTFIVQFDDVGTFDDSSASLTFQVQLGERCNTIEYHYASLIDGVLGGFDASGGGATIGIEDAGGADGLSISCDVTGAVADGDGLRIELGVAAVQVVRAGSCPNPTAYMLDPAGGPRIGTTWNPFVDHTTFAPGAALDFQLFSVVSQDVPLAIGCLLCNIPPPDLIFLNPNPGSPFGHAVTPDCALTGLALCTQAGSASFGPLNIELANAIDIVLGNF